MNGDQQQAYAGLLHKNWGLAKDLLAELESLVFERYIIFEIDQELFALEEKGVREILQQPILSSWHLQQGVSHIFMHDGNIYGLIDFNKNLVGTRKLAMILHFAMKKATENRYLALAADSIVAVRELTANQWRTQASKQFHFVNRCLDYQQKLIFLIDLDLILNYVDDATDTKGNT